MHRSIVFVCIILLGFSLYSQEKEEPGLLSTKKSFIAYLPSDFDLNRGLNYNYGLENGKYDLEKILPGLYLNAENYHFETLGTNVQGGGYIFKYQKNASRTYMVAGPQFTQLIDINGERIYKFGVSAGVGHEINDNLSLEARYFQNLNPRSYSPGYDQVQPPVMNPLSLKIKTSF